MISSAAPCPQWLEADEESTEERAQRAGLPFPPWPLLCTWHHLPNQFHPALSIRTLVPPPECSAAPPSPCLSAFVWRSVAWGGACVNVLGWVCGLGWWLCECVSVGLWLGVVLV